MIKFFQKFPEVLAAMSEKEDGSMKLFKENNLNLGNRASFFEKIGIGKNKIIAAEIVHGVNVVIVDTASPKIILEADGLVTKDKNIFLSVTVADCIPVYFYEPDQKIMALAHCGWRGIIGGIIGSTLEKILALGGSSENIKIALGPGIDKCHFEIKEDVLEKFGEYEEFVLQQDGRIFVDLKGIIKRQLNMARVSPENIENYPDCTFESSRYFSYRREKPETIEAMLAIIGTK